MSPGQLGPLAFLKMRSGWCVLSSALVQGTDQCLCQHREGTEIEHGSRKSVFHCTVCHIKNLHHKQDVVVIIVLIITWWYLPTDCDFSMPSNFVLFSKDVAGPKKTTGLFHRWHRHCEPCTPPLWKCATLSAACWLMLHQRLLPIPVLLLYVCHSWSNILHLPVSKHKQISLITHTYFEPTSFQSIHCFPEGIKKQFTGNACTWKLSIWELQAGEKPSHHEGHHRFGKRFVIVAGVVDGTLKSE